MSHDPYYKTAHEMGKNKKEEDGMRISFSGG
jgi:hypothetical protein